MCNPNPQTLRYRAEELCTIAETMQCEDTKQKLLRCARDYERWAERMEQSVPA